MKSPNIEAFSFGRITIDGQTYTNDLIIFHDRISENWWRIAGHNLDVRDLRSIFQDPPETLIIGQGASARMIVPDETRKALQDAGIETLALPTEEACRCYNALRDQHKTAAALHLTC